ncbi:YbaB/EbfC family nucleoid-associated protein [Lentzea sp. E54]|uniref:YbaB/EbfC family nucleoid-associated protein n=1 Tax=Lentzea xerophila TaxID=3435883 RepID=UPI003DA25738
MDGIDVERVHRQLAGLRATAISADGFLTATAGFLGNLLELDVDPRVYRIRDAQALARSVLDTTRTAVDRATQAALEVAAVVLPTPGHVDLLFGPPLRELDRLNAQTRATTPGSRPALRSGIDYEAERRALIKCREAMPAIRETAESDDGLVAATADARGRLLDLSLHQSIYRAPDSRRLAEGIITTARRATERARARLHATTAAPRDVRS